jgi:hypothetical protein
LILSLKPTLREQLERAMAALDSQRDTLGDLAVDAARRLAMYDNKNMKKAL